MSERIGGVLSVTIDGTPCAARGNFSFLGPQMKREGIAGQDRVHGFVEKWSDELPGIKGDLTTPLGLSIEAIQAITPSTIILALANGHSYALHDARCVEAFKIRPDERHIGVEFVGTTCPEI